MENKPKDLFFTKFAVAIHNLKKTLTSIKILNIEDETEIIFEDYTVIFTVEETNGYKQ